MAEKNIHYKCPGTTVWRKDRSWVAEDPQPPTCEEYIALLEKQLNEARSETASFATDLSAQRFATGCVVTDLDSALERMRELEREYVSACSAVTRLEFEQEQKHTFA